MFTQIFIGGRDDEKKYLFSSWIISNTKNKTVSINLVNQDMLVEATYVGIVSGKKLINQKYLNTLQEN